MCNFATDFTCKCQNVRPEIVFVAKLVNKGLDVLQIIMHFIFREKELIRRWNVINKSFRKINPTFSLNFTSYISVSVWHICMYIIMTFKQPWV